MRERERESPDERRPLLNVLDLLAVFISCSGAIRLPVEPDFEQSTEARTATVEPESPRP